MDRPGGYASRGSRAGAAPARPLIGITLSGTWSDLLKQTSFFILAIACGFAAFYYMGGVVQSVDYHDGEYHPIPRERYTVTMLLALVASVVFWKLARRSGSPRSGAG